MAANRFPAGGVFIYAMMAAGGDLGGSVGPQLVGLITDAVIAAPSSAELAVQLGITVEQLGMKAGMFGGMVFPTAAIFLYFGMLRAEKKRFNKT